MRRRPKHQIPTKYILLSMTALCILAMYVSFSLNLGGGPLNSIAGAIFEPMQKGINYAGTWLSDKADNSGHMDYLVFAKQAIIHTVSLLKELYQHL